MATVQDRTHAVNGLNDQSRQAAARPIPALQIGIGRIRWRGSGVGGVKARPASGRPAPIARPSPVRRVASQRRTGACYRALWCLPGRDFHPQAWTSFQDATRKDHSWPTRGDRSTSAHACSARLRGQSGWRAVMAAGGSVGARVSARRDASGGRCRPAMCQTRSAASAAGIPAAVTSNGRAGDPRTTGTAWGAVWNRDLARAGHRDAGLGVWLGLLARALTGIPAIWPAVGGVSPAPSPSRAPQAGSGASARSSRAPEHRGQSSYSRRHANLRDSAFTR